MKAVIMAGGQGSRLRPLTCDLPKPMVPILNLPVMEHIINLLQKQGIREIAVTTYYQPQVIEDYFGDGSNWGVQLHYYLEKEPLGTAGSVHNAEEFLDETFLVVSGDAITDFQLEEAIKFHQAKEAWATLVLTQEEIPLDYGVVMTEPGGKISRFLEKPSWGQVFSDKINTGIYVLEPDIFELYPRNQKFDFSKDLFPLMLKKGLGLYALSLQGYWNDIGSLEAYHRTQFDLLTGKLQIPIEAAHKYGEDIWVEEGVEISEEAELRGPLFIGAGTKIAGGVKLERSVIGRNCRIQPYASLKRSIVWDNCLIGPQAELRGCIIANNVTLRERAAVFDQTAIGRYSFIGKDSKIRSGVKIWPNKVVGEGIEVDKSIIWPTHWSKHLFSQQGVVGKINVDITPEFISDLAVAYAATLAEGAEVVLSSDNYAVSDAFKRIMAGGLQTAGKKVVDIDSSTSAVTRYSVVKLAAAGAVHFRLSHHDPENLVVEFYNQRGINLSPEEQKGIEKKFFVEDYNRVLIEEVGVYTFAPGMAGEYVRDLVASVASREIKRHLFSIVLDYEHDNLGDLLPLLLKKLNCQLLSTRNYSQKGLPLSLEERMEARETVARIMRENQADLGIIIDHNAENINLVKYNGEVVSQAEYQLLISYLLLERGYKVLYLPFNSPRVVEELAQRYGARVEYTPLNPQAPMDKHYQEAQTQFKSPFFYPYSDGLAGLVLILEKMALDNVNLDQLVNLLPKFYINKAELPCAWQDKGRVMRLLSEEVDKDAELIDGIKFNHPRGWSLVVPDGERPVFHIYSEGQDQEAAESLTGFYLDKLKNIIENK